MDVSIPKDLEARIRARLAAGEYRTVSEVVGAALRRFLAQEESGDTQLARLRSEIDEGLRQARDGEVVDGPEALRRLRAKLDDTAPKDE